MATDRQTDTFAQFTPPGKLPKVNSIFDFSDQALAGLRLWLEQNPPAIAVTSIIGFKQQQDIRGRVDSTGAIVSGTGFTVSKLGTGNYQITFNTKQSAVPAIGATIDNNTTNLACKVANASTTVFQVLTYDMAGVAADSGFYFTASPFT